MPSLAVYDPSVAARTRCAAEILINPALLTAFRNAGGIEADLEEIKKHGEDAHAYNTLQSAAAADGEHATLALANAFLTLQGDYSAVMAVVQAVVGQMQRSGTTPAVATQLGAILKNEVPVTIREVEVKGVKKKRARKVQGAEAIRSEIQKDASALCKLTEAHAALAARGVTLPRLQALESSAKALSGKLAERSVKKGGAKVATQQERAAVTAQRQVWGATYRVFLKAAATNEAIRGLLSEAAR